MTGYVSSGPRYSYLRVVGKGFSSTFGGSGVVQVEIAEIWLYRILHGQVHGLVAVWLVVVSVFSSFCVVSSSISPRI